MPKDVKSKRSSWAMFLKAHALVVGRIEERLRSKGLPSLDWYDVLWALEQAPGQRLRMHELAQATVITRSNLTRLADRLEAVGLLMRDRDCSDRRGAFAVLTSAGRKRRREMWEVYGKAIEDLFESQLRAGEAGAMQRVLERIIAAAK